MRRLRRSGFTLVEILITFCIMVMLYFAAWYTFKHSMWAQKETADKMQNIHAAATVIEYLRHELTGLPDFGNIDEKFIAEKVSEGIKYDKVEMGKNPQSVTFTLDKERKTIVRTVDSKKDEFGQGRILEFKFTHNINQEKPNFPTWIKVRIKTINENNTEVMLEATFYPRLINRNIQLEQTL